MPDDRDECAETADGITVGTNGCEVEEHCHEGDCTVDMPRCETQEECDRLTERPLLRQVPRATLVDAIRRELSKQPHDINCPDKLTPPDQPHLTAPAQGINPVPIGQVTVRYESGDIVESPKEMLHFEWEPVEDSCAPVKYSVLLEYYHCHKVSNLLEAGTYYNRGWCKWMPLTYASNLTGTSFDYEFDIGAHLAKIHEPFETELNWNPPEDGPFAMSYMPIWVQARVIAHDANGTPSPFGMHSDQRYVVFYNEAATLLRQLYEIPIAP